MHLLCRFIFSFWEILLHITCLVLDHLIGHLDCFYARIVCFLQAVACLRNTAQDREALILEGQQQRESSSSSASDDQWFWILMIKFMSLVSRLFFQVLNSYIKLLKLRDPWCRSRFALQSFIRRVAYATTSFDRILVLF